MSLLDTTYVCLYFYVVPIAIQAFVQMMHKFDKPLVIEVVRQSIQRVRNSFFHFFISYCPFTILLYRSWTVTVSQMTDRETNGKTSCSSSIVNRLFSRMWASTLSFKSSVTTDERPDRAPLWTSVLPPLTNDTTCAHSPHSWHLPHIFRQVWRMISAGWMFFAFENRITERTSQPAGLVIDMVLYKPLWHSNQFPQGLGKKTLETWQRVWRQFSTFRNLR
jgi:hypothetical protein